MKSTQPYDVYYCLNLKEHKTFTIRDFIKIEEAAIIKAASKQFKLFSKISSIEYGESFIGLN